MRSMPQLEEEKAYLKCLETLRNSNVNIRLLKLKLIDQILYLILN